MTRRDLGVAGVAILGTLALMPRARSQGTEQAVMGSTAVAGSTTATSTAATKLVMQMASLEPITFVRTRMAQTQDRRLRERNTRGISAWPAPKRSSLCSPTQATA